MTRSRISKDNPPRRPPKQAGYVTLIMVLVLLVLGALVITPLLGFVIAGTRQGQQREERTQEFYAADAGVEDALWRIRNSALPEYLLDAWQQDYWDSPSAYTCRYAIDPDVNGRQLDVSLRRLWLLQGLENPVGGTESLRGLVISGTVTGDGQYQISLVSTLPGALRIERIACFLPSGCRYVRGSSNLEQDLSVPPLYRCVPHVVFDVDRNGWVISWDYSGMPFGGLDYGSLPGDAVTKTITFRFDAAAAPRGAFAWVRTGRDESGLAFSSGVDFYQITSTGADPLTGQYTTVVARAIREGAGSPGAAISGDYRATGNTLLRDHDRSSWDQFCRERLYLNSPAKIGDIPPGARVEKVLLYWSGWMNTPWDAWYEDCPLDEWTTAHQQALLDQVETQRLDRVHLQVQSSASPIHVFSQPVTASLSQVLPNGSWQPGYEHGWSYSCRADVTDRVKDYFASAGVAYSGNATYTMGHVASSLGSSGSTLYIWNDRHLCDVPCEKHNAVYPLGSTTNPSGRPDEWAYAGWSVVVIYSSPEVVQHQLYLYDTFRYCHNDQTLVFPIAGFLAPSDVFSDPVAARFTCFVGEGDDVHLGDGLSLNGWPLPHPADGVNPFNNVWNSRSNVLPVGLNDGIDIDTFIVGNGLAISPGDTGAVVEAGAGPYTKCEDSWNLIYIILSFRTDITSVTLISYLIETGG